MGFYNPHAPGVVGQEWVPIRYEPYPIPRGVETGHGFRLTEPTALAEALVYLDELPPQRLNNQVLGAAVYPRGREAISGPIHTNTIAVRGGFYSGDITVVTSPDQSLISPSASGRITFDPGDSIIDFLFATDEVSPPAGARILEVQFRYIASGPFGQIPAGAIRVGILEQGDDNILWLADTLHGPATPETNTGLEIISAGDSNLFWDNPAVTLTQCLPWRSNHLRQFDNGVVTPQLRLRFDTTNLPEAVRLLYLDMHVRWCSEQRVAVGGTPFWADPDADLAASARHYVLDDGFNDAFGPGINNGSRNDVPMREVSDSFDADPVLDPGDYTLVVTMASNGGLGAGGATPTINAVRQLYPMPDHPGIEITLPGSGGVSERNRYWSMSGDTNPFWLVTASQEQDTFQAKATDVLPHLSLYDPDGNALLGVHVYGRQTTRAASGDNPVWQGIDLSTSDGRPYPWLRFYARRLHSRSGVPLTVQWILGSQVTVIGQVLPAVFEALPVIVDGWREVNLRLDPVPNLFPGAGRFLVDTFSRNVVGGWGTADTGQEWTPLEPLAAASVDVDGTQAVLDFTGVTTSGITTFRADGGGHSEVDITVRAQVSTVGTYTQYLWTFSNAPHSLVRGYQGVLWMRDDLSVDVQLVKQSSGFVPLSAAVDTGLTLTANTWYWLRVRVERDPDDLGQQLLRAKAWEDGDPEPGWMVSATDSDFLDPGYMAVGAVVESPDGSAREFRIDSITAVGSAPIAQLQFAAPGLDRPEQWQILGAEALGFPPRNNAPATYGQPESGASANFADFATPQWDGSDATALLAQDPPQPEGLAVELAELPLSGVGEACGMDVDCVPTSLLYHQVTWDPVPYPEALITDIFNRVETDQWGSANVGGAWTETGGAAADFEVGPLGAGLDAGMHHVDAAAGALYSTIGAGIGDVDIRTALFLADPAGIGGSTGGGLELGVVLRWQDASNHIQVRLTVADPDVVASIVLVQGGTETILAEQTFTLASLFNPITYLRVQADGEVIRVKIWDLSDTEPVAWSPLLAVTDDTFTTGAVGVRSRLDPDTATGPETVYYLQFAATGVQANIFAIFGGYELQRADEVDPDWHTICTVASPDVTAFDDFEARVGVVSRYRVRIGNVLDFAGPWSEVAEATLPAPGVGGPAGNGVLIFTSNQDGDAGLAYTMQWSSSPQETFTHPEVETQALQRIYGKDYFTAMRPLERGGQQFTRTILVQNAAVATPILQDAFHSLRDLAWEQLPYVCVRTEQGDRWLANVTVPEGTISRRRRLQLAQITVTQVTDTPAVIESAECEGMVSLSTPIYAQAPHVQPFDDTQDEFDLRILARMDNWQAPATLAARMGEPAAGRLEGFLFSADLGQVVLEVRETDGTSDVVATYRSTEPIPFEPGEFAWLRVVWQRDDGGGDSQAVFSTSTDGDTWVQLGAAVTHANQPVHDSSAPLQVGALQGPDSLDGVSALQPARGLTVAELRWLTAPGGDVLASPDFAAQPAGTTLFADAQDNTWSLVGGGTCQR